MSSSVVEELNKTLLLKTAIRVSLNAGKAIMEVYESGDFDAVLKNDLSPLSRADKVSHEIITSMLALTNIPILSEEDSEIEYHLRKEWSRFWLVDPLDGTKEFLNRNGDFTVNIALMEQGRPVMGVIFVPATSTLYFGGSDLGGFKIQDTAGIENLLHDLELLKSNAQTLPGDQETKTLTVVASRSHVNEETSFFVDELRTRHGEVDFISKGSSLKICLVAEGVADVYPRLAPTMEWDIAAGDAIASASGCKLVNHHTGEPLHYNKEHLVNPHFVVYRKGFLTE
ncbi:MAG: 3'(2'),5'-bisphosphate nucleotidase CysQ [Bacteroidota bacterium]|jgi:3'(2'), 5'-bisphosphate nucleotidase